MVTKNIKLISFLSFMCFVLFIYSSFGYYTLNKHHDVVDVNLNSTNSFITKSVTFLINKKKIIYEEKSKEIFTNKNILYALKHKDRESFYKLVKPYFNEMKLSDNNLWGFHIILPNNQSFIRVHKPEVYDNMIDKGKKPIIDEVNRTKKLVTGFETGKFGYFLRVVIPIFSTDNEYIGLAEFSINVDSFTQYIKDTLGYESLFLIKNIEKKEFLNDLPKTKDNLVIFKSTSQSLTKYLEQNNVSSIDLHKNYNNIINDNNYLYKILKFDISPTSNLIVTFEITDIIGGAKSFENNIYKLIVILIIISAIVWIFITNSFLKHTQYQKSKMESSEIIMSQNVIYSRTNLKGIITEVSEAFCIISGYEMDELLGQPHNIIRHPDMKASDFENLWETIQSGNTWRGEVQNLKKDGTYYWVTAAVSPEYDSKGNKKGYLSIRHDITLKKEIEVLNITLEKRVKEEVEINLKKEKEKQLIEQSKMISMGEMIGNIAHQWRQPLSFISSLASSVKLNSELGMIDTNTVSKDMDIILDKTQYLSQTINTFRDFINEKQELKELTLQDSIKSSIKILESVLENNYITIVNNINCDEPVKIEMVVGELSQVIINILNNAKDILIEKDIQDGWVKLELEKYKDKVVLTIEDNGGGIPNEIITKIFDPYFTTKHKSQGTGLGLHLSYKIVTDSLKGNLFVKNTSNGAKFYIELPLK